MKTTAKGVILGIMPEQKGYLDNLMVRWNAAIRFAFKRIADEFVVQDVRAAAQSRFELNSRQANDAVFVAQNLIASQRELVKIYADDSRRKAAVIEEQLKKARSTKRIIMLSTKFEKWKQKAVFWKRHREAGTFPPVVFGGKRLFRERCKGNVTRAEWHEARSSHYLSRGDRTKGGNLNARLYMTGNTMMLDLASYPVKTGKSVRYERLSFPVYIAEKRSKKTGKVNGIPYREMLIEYLATGRAYQVEIRRQAERYYLNITFEEETPQTYIPHEGILGIDTNPTGLALCLTDYLGRFRWCKWMDCGQWPDSRSGRREHLIGVAAKRIAKFAASGEVALAIEDLVFRQDKSVTSKFNRMSGGFCWSMFLTRVERNAARLAVPLVKVPPQWTTTIGILKYAHQYGLSGHGAAAHVIARRGLGFAEEKQPKALRALAPPAPTKAVCNWELWNIVRKAVFKFIKPKMKGEVKHLGFWQHCRKETLGIVKSV